MIASGIKINPEHNSAAKLRLTSCKYFKDHHSTGKLSFNGDTVTFEEFLSGFGAKDRRVYLQHIVRQSRNTEKVVLAKKLLLSDQYSYKDSEYLLYVEYMQDKMIFADELIIHMCARVLKRNIMVVNSSSPNNVMPFNYRSGDFKVYSANDGQTLLILNHGNLHFFGAVLKYTHHNSPDYVDLSEDDVEAVQEKVSFETISIAADPIDLNDTDNVSIVSPDAVNLLPVECYSRVLICNQVCEKLLSQRTIPVSSNDQASVTFYKFSHLNDSYHLNEFTVADLELLNGPVWLNDQVINSYCSLLRTRDQKKSDLFRLHNLPYVTSQYLSTYFFAKLMSFNKNIYNYSNVKSEFHSNRKEVNIFKMNKVFIPINISNTHWVLVVVYISQKTVCYYDSYGSDGSRFLVNIMKWIKEESHICREQYSETDWKVISRAECPRQRNGFDCGVFVLISADVLSDDIPMNQGTYTQSDFKHFRKKIACDLVRKSLLY
jgi:hypothetical protein